MTDESTKDWTLVMQHVMQSCNHFPNYGQLLREIQTGTVHDHSMTSVSVLGNDHYSLGSNCNIA